MNHPLTLTLELLKQTPVLFHLRLTARNESSTRLLLPDPRITDIRFGDPDSPQVARWGTTSLSTAFRRGHTIQPGHSISFEWRVRPRSAPHQESDPRRMSEYELWSVALWPGEHLVWYEWNIDGAFWDSESHMRLPDLQRLAERENAVAWTGDVESNRLRIVHPG